MGGHLLYCPVGTPNLVWISWKLKKFPRNIFCCSVLWAARSVPQRWRCRRACLTAPSPRPLLKKSKLSDSVQICWATAHGHYWPGISLERDDMKLILNSWWTDNFHKSHNAHVPYHTIHHWEQKCAHFCSECFMLWDMGHVQCEICEIVQLSQNKTKCNSIMASPGLIYIHIYPPGDKGLMYILVY